MIAIRYKPLRNGGYSIYLDIYSAGKRERKFPGLRSSKDYSKTKFISKEDFEAVEKAKQIARELSGENSDNQKKGKEAIPSLVEFIQSQISKAGKIRSTNQSLVKHLRLFNGKKDVPFNIISGKWIKSFESYLNEHLAESSINNLLFTLKGIFNHAIESCYLKANPLSAYKHNHHSNHVRPYLTDLEIEALASTSTTFNPVTRQAFFFALHSGLTWEQVSTLLWEQIKTDKKKKKEVWTVTVNGHLNHAIYINELSASAIEVLKEVAKTDVCSGKINVCELKGNVFKRLPNKPNVNIRIRLWGAMAEIERNVCFSMARNTYAMKHVEKGMVKGQLRRLLNVSRTQTVKVYERMNKNKSL
jgi:site-specific recombinase XerD